MNNREYKVVSLIGLILVLALAFGACENGELGETTPDTYNAEVIIEGVVDEDHAEFFSVLKDGESGVDQFSYDDNTLIGDITGLSGTTELTLVIDNNSLTDGEYTTDNKVIEVDSDNNEAKFEVEFLEEEESDFAGGVGTETNPYQVANADQLNKVRYYLDNHFKQIDDIDLSGYDNWEPIGDEDSPFTKSYDGDGYKINNLTINREFEDYVGLFSYIESAEMKTIKLNNIQITGFKYVGGLSGYSENGTILNININGDITGNQNTGGLIGYNSGDIIESYTKGDVSGSNYTGGLVGVNSGEIIESYAEGNINGDDSTGGLVGVNYRIIIKSYAKGSVNGENQNTGGFAGDNIGDIRKSYAKGNVSGKYITGGFVGRHGSNGNITESYAEGNVSGEYITGGFAGISSADIRSCYSLGDVTGRRNRVGGFAGNNNDRILYSYSSGEVTGDNDVGGFVGDNEGVIGFSYYDKDIAGIDEENGTPKSTEEMIQQNTFEPEWDFDTIWDIDEGSSYPYFKWQDENIPVPPDN